VTYDVVVTGLEFYYDSSWPPENWHLRTSHNTPVGYTSILWVVDQSDQSVSFGDLSAEQAADEDSGFQYQYPFLIGKGGGASVRSNCIGRYLGHHCCNISNAVVIAFVLDEDITLVPRESATSALHDCPFFMGYPLALGSAQHASFAYSGNMYSGKFGIEGVYTTNLSDLRSIYPLHFFCCDLFTVR